MLAQCNVPEDLLVEYIVFILDGFAWRVLRLFLNRSCLDRHTDCSDTPAIVPLPQSVHNNVGWLFSTDVSTNKLISHISTLSSLPLRFFNTYVKIRPWLDLRVPGGRLQDIRRMKVVRLSARAPLLPRRYSWHSFLLEAGTTPELSHWKILMTASGIEPATFQLIAQCLDQLRQRVPPLTFRRRNFLLNFSAPCI